MASSNSSNGGQPHHGWYNHQLPGLPITQDLDFNPTSESTPIYQATASPGYSPNVGPGGQNDWERDPLVWRQDSNMYGTQQAYPAQTNSAPPQTIRERQYGPPREYHSESGLNLQSRFARQGYHSGYPDNSSLSPFSSHEMSTSIVQSRLSPSVQSNISSRWNQCHSNNFNGLPTSSNSSLYNGNPNSLDGSSTGVRRGNEVTNFQAGGTQLTAQLIDRSRLDTIRGWMLSRSDAYIFDPVQIQLLAVLLAISIQDVQQLIQRVVRDLGHSVESAENAGRFNVPRSPSYSSLMPVPPPLHSPSEQPPRFAAALEWLRIRGPRCNQATSQKALKRRDGKRFQCTRCGCGFAQKYEWFRHEHTGIYPQEAWLCDFEATTTVNGIATCIICDIQNPDSHPSHVPHTSCQNKPTFDRRIFFRKDQFNNHFKKCHPEVQAHEYLSMSHILVNTDFPRNCGFCPRGRFQNFKSRMDHIAKHYKKGEKDMRYWGKPSDFVPDEDSDEESDSHNPEGDEDDDDDSNDDDETGGEAGQDSDPHNEFNYQQQFPGSSHDSGGSGYGYPPAFGMSNGSSHFPTGGNHGGQQYNLAFRSSPLSEIEWSDQSDNMTGEFDQMNNLPVSRRTSSQTALAELILQFPAANLESELAGPAAVVTRPPRTTSHFVSAVKRIKGSVSRKYQGLRNSKSVVPDQMRCLPPEEILPASQNATKSNETISTFVDSHYGLPPISYSSSSSIVLKRTGLEQRLLDAQIPWGNSRFLPKDAFDELLTHAAIQKELDAMQLTHTSPLVDKIYKRVRKIFGILVCIGKRNSITSFVEHGITDADLPFEIPREATQQKIWMCDAFRGFSHRQLDEFARVQWSFLAPEFASDQEIIKHYEFDGRFVLPFVEDTELEARSGGFGEVWSVVIHPAHHTLLGSRGNIRFAIKRLHSRDKADFIRESSMLKTLTRKKHDHLIKLLCTYKFKGHYHLMFPFAEANLRQFWEMTPPQSSPEILRWVFDQMGGIASALDAIHYHLPPVEGLSDNDDLRVSIPRTEYYYGRHGDIKPENILWFSQPGPYGILVITDLGLSDCRTQHSRSNVNARNLGGSVTYAPPELALNTPVSRAFDIWSLGCVYLEFLTWLLHGWKGLEKFGDDRLILGWDEIEDDSFYSILSGSETKTLTAEIRPAVKNWIIFLDNSPTSSGAIHDLLELIKTRMLIIPPQDRIQSAKLSGKLVELFGTSQESRLQLR